MGITRLCISRKGHEFTKGWMKVMSCRGWEGAYQDFGVAGLVIIYASRNETIPG